jgi:5-methylcytosine-specific restriction endonuclease McrA
MGICPLCSRETDRMSDHHLVPRSRGGVETVTICVDCHRAIHARFDTKVLEARYSTVQSLLEDAELARTIRYISKQPVTKVIPTQTSKRKRRRGR